MKNKTPGPIKEYSKCATWEEKRKYQNNNTWLVDKKFDWIKLKETQAHTESIKENAFEGWYSKFQVADYEKIPHDHPLLQAKLNTLPCRAHPVQEWADLGKKEYYYTSSQTANKQHWH